MFYLLENALVNVTPRLKIKLAIGVTSRHNYDMDSTTTQITDESIAALCARCDSASIAASSSLEQLAAAPSKRKRAEWRREHIIRLGMLDRAAHNLLVALFVQPHAVDALTPSMRQYATHIHGYAVRSLNNFRA